MLLGPDRGPASGARRARPNLLAAAAVYRLERTGGAAVPRRGGVTLRRSRRAPDPHSPPSQLLGAAALVAPAAAGAATPIKVNEKEFTITGVPKTLKHGVKYTVTLSNKGKFPHDMLFDGKRRRTTSACTTSTPSRRARARRFSVTFPQAGTFEFYCAIKGHAAKGMKGKVKVT